jgi:hypothetical protein
LQENSKSEMDRTRPLKLVLGAKTKWVTMWEEYARNNGMMIKSNPTKEFFWANFHHLVTQN